MGSPFLPSFGPPDAGARYAGVQKVVNLPPPAAGASPLYTVEAGTWQRVLLIAHRFTASAGVGNRFPQVVIRDPDGNNLWAQSNNISVGASTIEDLFSAAGTLSAPQNFSNVGTVVHPGVWLPSGYQIGVAWQGIQGSDQVSAFRVLVEEIDQGELGEDVGLDRSASL